MKIFIDSLEIPEKELENFIEETKKRIDELGSSTLKAYQILQHFFEHEAYNIAQNIKKIDVFCRDLESSLKNKDIEESKAIKSGIKDLKDSIKNKEKLKNKIKEKENNIKDLEKEKNSIGSELSKKEQSQDYKDYYKLEVEKYQLQEDIEELKSEFLHYFSVLEHSLKKHLKISFDDEKLLARYIEDPINALLDDKNLGIIDILKKVENNVLKEVIDLKDKKKEKTLEVIQQINHEKINPFLDEYAKLKEKIKKISEDMSSYSVLEDIEKIKKMLEEKNEELEKAKKDAENLTKDILKIDISQLKKGLKEKIDDFLNVDLSLD
jgi:DNA repair exonuclease SbcCD ATPase subunit